MNLYIQTGELGSCVDAARVVIAMSSLIRVSSYLLLLC